MAPTAPTSTATGRLIEISRPEGGVWVVTLANPPENRLIPPLLMELLAALDTVEAEWRTAGGPGALIIKSDNPKFFSNGLDPKFLGTPDFSDNVWEPAKMRLLKFPLVTIACVEGHCFAGGMLLALCCDYRVMTAAKGLWSMNELLIGVPIAPPSMSIMQAKLTPHVIRDLLIGKRYNQAMLLQGNIVDEVVDNPRQRCLELARELGKNVSTGLWGSIKDSQYRDVQGTVDVKKNQVLSGAEQANAFWTRLDRTKAYAERMSKL